MQTLVFATLIAAAAVGVIYALNVQANRKVATQKIPLLPKPQTQDSEDSRSS